MSKKNAKFAMMEKLAREKGETTMGIYFIKDGLDYKGQEQHAYTVNGYGAGFDVKIDAGKLIGMSAAVGFSGDVTRSSEVMLVASVGPAVARYEDSRGASRTERLKRPITLACMQGVMWEGKAGASFEIGIGFEAEAAVKTTGASAEAKSSFDDDDEDEPGFEAEIVGAKFEAFAGFKASASYTYTNVALEDMYPSFFGAEIEGAGKGDLRTEAEDIMTNGSRKDILRERAVAFMNQHQDIFGKQKTSSWLFFDRSSQDITKALQPTKVKSSVKVYTLFRVLALADNWVAKLQPYNGGVPQRGLCTLTLSSHAPEGKAGVEASIEVSAGLGPLAGVEASATVSGPTVSGSGKWSSYRYQTYWPIDSGDALLMYTQETKISYWQVDLSLIGVEAKLEASVIDASSVKQAASNLKTAVKERDFRGFEGPKRIGFTTEDIRGKEEGNRGFKGASDKVASVGKKLAGGDYNAKKTWNSMSYQSACVYWVRPDSEAECTKVRTVSAQEGSGVCLGRSTQLSTLQKLLTCYWDEDTKDFMEGSDKSAVALAQTIGAALHVHPKRLLEAIWDSNIKGLVNDLASNEANVNAEDGEELDDLPLLIEAGFAFPIPALDLSVKTKGFWGKVQGKDLPEAEWVATLDAKLRDKAFKAFKTMKLNDLEKHLQSIRIRIRMADLETNDDSFKLGFNVLGTELGIRLNKVERAGSSGVVDLATYWFPTAMRAGGTEAYERAVPKVILFDQ